MKRSGNIVYLDNAATTFPKPREVVNETARCIRQFCGNPGRASHAISMKAADAVFQCRSSLASLFGGKEENVIFTSSATHSLNLGIKSLLHRGDHVLISDIEHNSVIRPISALAKRGLITFDVYEASSDPVTAVGNVSAHLKPNTAMVIACHHSNICNLIQPIQEIGELCRRKGIIFLVDAAQSAGILDIDIDRDNVDVLCAPGHKGLYGIPGSGFVLFGDTAFREERPVSTFIEGGNGVRSLDDSMPDFLPERLEAGTLAVPAIRALSAGVSFVKKRGIKEIERRERELFKLTERGLARFGDIVTVYGDGEAGGILLFSSPAMPSERIAAALDRYGICVRAGFHCAPTAHKRLGTPEEGAVRVSFGAFNTQKEVFYFLNVLDHLLKAGKHL